MKKLDNNLFIHKTDILKYQEDDILNTLCSYENDFLAGILSFFHIDTFVSVSIDYIIKYDDCINNTVSEHIYIEKRKTLQNTAKLYNIHKEYIRQFELLIKKREVKYIQMSYSIQLDD